MAKWSEGDRVRLKTRIQIGTILIKTAARGEIVKIEKTGFLGGPTKYHVKWEGHRHPLIMQGDRQFVLQGE